MRDAHYERQVLFSTSSPPSPIGISLGYDRCAEHEHGFSQIQDTMSIPHNRCPIGLEQRLPTATPEELLKCFKLKEFKHTVKANPCSGNKTKTIRSLTLEFASPYHWLVHSDDVIEKPNVPSVLQVSEFNRHVYFEDLDIIKPVDRGNSDKLIRASWSIRQFKVTTFGDARCSVLKSLYQAAIKGRVTCTLSRSTNPFSGSGLCLVDVDSVPANDVQAIIKADTDRFALYEMVASSGVEQMLEKAGKKYFALSPRLDRNGELQFFLNPSQQHLHNFGWFSVDQLREWAADKGPVMKTPA